MTSTGRSALQTLQAFSPRPLTAAERRGDLDWSLDFFTDTGVAQNPFVYITLQLDVTEAYATYKSVTVEGLSFFAFLIWHLARAMQGNLGFKLRKIGAEWLMLENAPIVVPVAVGGAERFAELLLQDVSHQTLPEMAHAYRSQLDAARRGEASRMDADTFLAACFIGNLPHMQFTALSLHWRRASIECQPSFYFGKRYLLGDKLFIPLAAKLHHACTDPFVLNALIDDFRACLGRST